MRLVALAYAKALHRYNFRQIYPEHDSRKYFLRYWENIVSIDGEKWSGADARLSAISTVEFITLLLQKKFLCTTIKSVRVPACSSYFAFL